MTITFRTILRTAPLVLIALAATGAAQAATGGAGGAMPWEGPLTAVMDSITGPVARIIAILIIVATGMTLAFGDVGQGERVEAAVADVVVLFETGKRSLVVTREPQGAIGEDPLGIAHVRNEVLDAPFVRRVARAALRPGGTPRHAAPLVGASPPPLRRPSPACRRGGGPPQRGRSGARWSSARARLSLPTG